MNKLKEYLEQDIWKPRYLFHGSPYEINILEPRKSTDTKNKENEDNLSSLQVGLLMPRHMPLEIN